jgi:thiamine pyridinylase
VPYAVQGVQVGHLYYGIPQLGCANLLFFDKTDTALARAETPSAVHAALGQCTYLGCIPPAGRGLMLNMAGAVNSATFYLDTAHSVTERYPLRLPWTPRQINPTAMANLRKMLAMASWENAALFTPGPYERSAWFSDGAGRAVVGYSESMSVMSEATRQSIAFKPMPLSNRPDARPLFYADVISVHPATQQRGTRALAVQLANVMAASATVVASIGPDAANPFPQYLLATRPSVFEALGQAFPLYNDLYAMVTRSRPQMFKLG